MYILIDIGGKKVRVSRVDDLVNPKILKADLFYAQDNYKVDLEELSATIKKVSDFSDDIEGITVCTAGVVDSKRKILLQSRLLKDWEYKPLATDLEQAFNSPVYIENNAVTGALSEIQYGGIEKTNFTFILWQDGIGATNINVVNDFLVVTPMEAGHHIIVHNGIECGCGQRGCFQLYCSEAGAKQVYGKPLSELNEGEWKEVVEIMACGIINLLCIKRTRLMVFSGITSVTRQDKVLEVFREVDSKLSVLDTPEFRISKLHDDAVTLGGAALILNHSTYYI